MLQLTKETNNIKTLKVVKNKVVHVWYYDG